MEIIPIILCAGFTTIGLIITAVGTYKVIVALGSTRWPCAEGVITHAGTKTVAGRAIFVMPDIRYKFNVHNKEYTGNHVAVVELGDTSGKTAKSIVSRYGLGEKIPVHYHPQRPTRCFLEPGIQSMTVAPLLVGILFLVSAPATIFLVRWINSMN